MSYLSKYYIMAENELNNRKAQNRRLQESHIAEAEKRIPQLNAMRMQLAAQGSRLASVLVSGENVKDSIARLSKDNLDLQRQIRDLLVNNGFSPDYLELLYSCQKCSDTGIFQGKRCSCFMEDVRRFQCMDLNSSSAMNLCSFETFDLSLYPARTESDSGISIRRIMESHYSYCREYAKSFHLPQSGILMNGGTGLGKTHLSLSIGKEVIEKGYSVIYGSAPDLFRKIEKEHFGNAPETDTAQLLQECDLLIVDDLGAEFESKFNESVLYNLLNTRINTGRPTVINTNYETSQLQKRYGDRTASRLLTMEILTFYGDDIRMIKKYSK